MLGSVTIDIGKALQVSVDLDRLAAHTEAFRYAITRGLKPTLSDPHASITGETHPDNAEMRKASLEASLKKLESLYAGEYSVQRTRTSEADPVGTEALRLARVWVGKRTAKTMRGATLTTWGNAFGLMGEKAIIAEAIKRYAAKPETVAAATKIVAESQALAADIEL